MTHSPCSGELQSHRKDIYARVLVFDKRNWDRLKIIQAVFAQKTLKSTMIKPYKTQSVYKVYIAGTLWPRVHDKAPKGQIYCPHCVKEQCTSTRAGKNILLKLPTKQCSSSWLANQKLCPSWINCQRLSVRPRKPAANQMWNCWKKSVLQNKTTHQVQ